MGSGLLVVDAVAKERVSSEEAFLSVASLFENYTKRGMFC